MASIQTGITLNDQFTGVIYGIINSVNMATATMENMQRTMNGNVDSSAFQSIHDEINQATSAMSQLNSGYSNMSRTVANTTQQIHNNVSGQHAFNQEINEGTSHANKLMNTIKGAVGAYVGLQGIAGAIKISDNLTQTKARLDMMNDGLQSTDELVNMVYASAQNARGSFTDMADVVARFGNNAKDAFGSSEEVVAFANLVQKQMTIAGASTAEASNAMLQLSQALGSGVLRGDELNSIFEQAPNLIQNIAKYIEENEAITAHMAKVADVSYEEMATNAMGHIRELASEGQLSAELVKNAIFSASKEINTQFEDMPMTWGQVWTTMGNAALMQMQPVLTKVNEIANNEDFQLFAANAVSAFSMVAVALLNILEYAGAVASFISENWSIIEPIVMGIVTALGLYAAALLIGKGIMLASAAATAIHTAMTSAWTFATFAETAAQQGLNAALLACPLTWIILLIIALIAIIYAVCAAIAKMTDVANSGFGVITGGVNVVIQFFKNLGLTVANIALGIGNAIAALGSNMMTAFHNAICSVQSWFYNLLSTALTVVAGICEALNKLPFVEFDYSGITSAADDYAAKASEAAGNKEDYKSIGDAFNDGMSTFDTFQDGWASDAFNAGAAWGDGVADKISNMFSGSDGGVDTSNMFNGGGYSGYDASQVPTNIADTAANTGKAADSLDITSEDLKYLRDIAERDTINRFTTAEVKVEMGGIINNVSGETDLDGIVDYLAGGVTEAMEKAAEGDHK